MLIVGDLVLFTQYTDNHDRSISVEKHVGVIVEVILNYFDGSTQLKDHERDMFKILHKDKIHEIPGYCCERIEDRKKFLRSNNGDR